MIPIGAGLAGAVLGLVLHKKYPKFGTVGKIAFAGAGGAAGFFIAKEVMKRMAPTSAPVKTADVPLQNG